MEKLLKLGEAAEILNVHPNTLRLWDRKGILVAVRIGEKKIRRYEIPTIKKFIKQNNNERGNDNYPDPIRR